MRRAARRLVAVVMLAAFGLPSATPLFAAGTAPMKCPGAVPDAPRAALLVTSTPVTTCPHAGATPCVSPVGCVAPAATLRAGVVTFEIPNSLMALGVQSIAPHGDLFRAGPPTPPPNSV